MREPDKNQIEALLKSITIPPQPKILLDLTNLFKKTDPDFNEIIRLVSSDIALSAKMMKLVNSPLFGARSRIDSINQALMMLGCDNFYTLVLSSTLQNAFSAGKENQAHIESLLDHSQKIAKICEVVSTSHRQISSVISRDLAYMTGLFHDCALPLLLRKFPDYKEVFASVLINTMPIESEDKLFATNHAVAAYIMTKVWCLPGPVSLAILYHHQYQYEGESNSGEEGATDKKLWAILVFAELISPMIVDAQYLGCASIDQQWIEKYSRIFDELSLDEVGIAQIIDEVNELVALC